MGTKVAYRTGTVEQHLAVPRTDAWAALIDALAGRPLGVALGDGCTEVVLSLEPPWRRVSGLAGGLAATERCEVTFTLRDDADECHLTWSFLVHPGPGDDALVAALHAVGGEILRVVADEVAPEP